MAPRSTLKTNPLARRRNLLLAGAAVLLIGGGAFGAAQIAGRTQTSTAEAQGLEPGPGEAQAQAQGEEHTESAGQEGLVELTADQISAAGITLVTPGRGGGAEAVLAGLVQPTPGAEADVGAPIGGVVERVYVAPGSSVRAGSPLALIRSAEGAVIRSEAAVVGSQADSARAEAQRAAAALARDTRLLEAGVISRQEWETTRATSLKAQADVRGAQAQARAAQARIAASGSPNAGGRATVSSPIAGVVSAVQTGPGGFLTQGASVARVLNPNLVELVFNAPAALVQRIGPGQELRVTGPNGNEFIALVSGIAPGADGAVGSTTLRARPLGPPPPIGTPVSARVVSGGSGALTVPADAVQTVENRPVVFVAARGGFRAVPVTPGRTAAGQIEILSGLTGGERVAGRNAFLLKAELAKGEAEHAH